MMVEACISDYRQIMTWILDIFYSAYRRFHTTKLSTNPSVSLADYRSLGEFNCRLPFISDKITQEDR